MTDVELRNKADSDVPEVVTKAVVRYVELPFGVGRFALVTLDNGFGGTRPNTLGLAGLAALAAALDGIVLNDVVGVGITGNASGFAAGADLKAVEAIRWRDEGLAIGRAGHAAFRRLGEMGVPTFAFYNGATLGGGVELGLHCGYRTIAGDVAAFGLPECSLGLVPAWGGTQLLPNLIGAEAAVRVIVENPLNQNRLLSARQVLDLGIAEALFEPAEFLRSSLDWAAKVISGEISPARRAVDRSEAAWTAALDRGKAVAGARVHGAAPAPYRALELIGLARTGAYDDGYACEDEALADLVMTDELRAGLYSFDLVQRRARKPVGAPDPALAHAVTKVGIVGAGLMASQLALLFASRLAVPVVMTDLDQARLDRGVGYVHREIDGLVAKGRLDDERAERIKALVTGSLTKDAFADAAVVVEAVFEEMSVKQEVFAEVEEQVSPECVLATNTSSLSVAEMAARLRHPERVVGLHFFNPVAVLPLLEVVQGERTDDASLATAFALAKRLGKTAVLVKDAPAFVVNRLLARFLGEVVNCVDEGTPFEVADAAMAPVGLPMSPLMLLQLVGPAIAQHVTETLHAAFPRRFSVSENLGRVVAAGKAGFYMTDGGRPRIDPEVKALFTVGGRPSTGERVRERALGSLAEEARLKWTARVVPPNSEHQVGLLRGHDLCMITGAGWPSYMGGLRRGRTDFLESRSRCALRRDGRRQPGRPLSWSAPATRAVRSSRSV